MSRAFTGLCKWLSNQPELGVIAGQPLTAVKEQTHGHRRGRFTCFHYKDTCICSGIYAYTCLYFYLSKIKEICSLLLSPKFEPSLYFNKNLGFFSTGGVIAYISSGSTSSPESCRSSSPSGSYLSTSPPLSRPSLPSRAVGMVVDMSPASKASQQRSQGPEKAGRSSSANKTCITSKNQAVVTNDLLLVWPRSHPRVFLSFNRD